MAFRFHPLKLWFGDTNERTSTTEAQIVGDFWLDTGTLRMYQYNGNSWVTRSAAPEVSATIASDSETLYVPREAAPSQTAEGQAVWDDDNDLLTIGTGAGRKTMVDTDSAQTLTNKTFTAPTMSDFSNANHDHGDADDGGALAASITLTTPTIAATGWTNANHAHAATNSGGTIAHNALTGLTGATSHPQTAKKTSNQSVNNSTTLVNDSELLYALLANDVIGFTLYLMYDAVAAADFKFAFTSPAASTISYLVTGPNSSDTLAQVGGVASGDAITLGAAGAGTTRLAVIHGSVVNGANAGNLQFQFAQATANASDARVLVGSYLHIVKM